MFIGRASELQRLKELWQKEEFSCVCLYGKRHVGKTALVNQFCKGKKTIYFSALDSVASDNLAAFSRALFACISPTLSAVPVLNDYESVFYNIDTYVRNERVVLVLDNFPNLVSCHPSILATLQYFIEHNFCKTGLFILLTGSSLPFMEERVMGSNSPLYGLFTDVIRLEPLSYRECAAWLKGRPAEEQAFLYGMTGGNPCYLNRLTAGPDLRENILSAFFMPDGLLLEEPARVMKQELRELQTYNAILAAIACGKNRLNEISAAAGLETGLCVKYLKNLEAMGLTKKVTPIASRDKKKSFYAISDCLFSFWYRFVPANLSHIASGRMILIYYTAVEDHINSYMEPVFADMCMEYLFSHCPYVPFEIGRIGKSWGTDPKTRSPFEVDILAMDVTETKAVFSTVSYGDKPLDTADYEKLEKASAMLPQFETRCYFLFSRSGFTDRLRELSSHENILLLTLEDLYT